MANINEAFPSNYLKASDIQGVEPIVAIDHVAFEPVGRQKEMKAVVYFKGKDKGLVLNKTNATKIATLTGSQETDDWTGQKIRLFATETEFGGETVECIRIKAAGTNGSAPQAKRKPTPPPDHDNGPLDDSDIPFAWLIPFILPALATAATALTVLA